MEETLVDYSRSSDQILVGVNEDRLTNTLHNEIKK